MNSQNFKVHLLKIIGTLKSYFLGVVFIGLFGWFLYEIPGKWIYNKTYDLINSEKLEKAEIQLKNGIAYIEKKDAKKAVDYFQKSAENGNITAQLILSEILLTGIDSCVSPQPAQSLELLENIIKRERNPHAEYLLGKMYNEGLGVSQNKSKAFDWFYKSAGAGFWYYVNNQDENGDPKAQYEIAQMYKAGEGVKQNLQKSEKWFLKCGETACKYGNSFYMNKDTSNAVYMFQLGTEVENAEALSVLGLWYLYGRGVEKNYKKAFDLLSRSISRNEENPASYRGLAEIYLNGYDVVEKNNQKAYKYYAIAADQGDDNAKGILRAISIKRNNNK